MPRERAKLSDKQEKILIQAQLMGLSAHDMQQIGNRLMALKKEAEEKSDIADAIYGFSWEEIKDETRKDGKAGWRITTPDQYVFDVTNPRKDKRNWYARGMIWDFHVDKPGTRFKTRILKDKSIDVYDNWKKKFMPSNSKDLYGIIRWIITHRYDWSGK